MTHAVTRETREQRAERIATDEIHACLSPLVSTLAEGFAARESIFAPKGKAYPAYALGEQAAELAFPVHDYESAAREAGWQHHENSWRGFFNEKTGDVSPEFRDPSTPEGCVEQLCQHYGIEPHDREVFEHWAITDWLADKLEAKGEKVDRDFAGLTVWARTTTGQSIAIDAVILEIAADLADVETIRADADSWEG